MKTLQSLSQILKPFKTFLILALAALAMYQTSQLWFVNITNSDFMFGRYGRTGGATEVNRIARPFRLVIGDGSGKFAVQYTGLADATGYAKDMIAQLLREGDFVAESPADYSLLTEQPVYLLEYAFMMPSDLFAEAFGRRAAPLTVAGVSAFHTVLIVPSLIKNDTTSIFFYDDQTKWEFSLQSENPHEMPVPDENALWHIWSNGNFIRLSPHEAGGAPFRFRQWENPYTNHFGEKLLDFIRERVAVFFDNPAAIKFGLGADGVYTFNSINTVVRYYDNDELTYASYRAVDGSMSPNVLTDYTAAIAFIEADTLMENEYFLVDFFEADERHYFMFNYVLDEGPVVTDTEFHIEVEVERGYVLRYRKLVHNFYLSD